MSIGDLKTNGDKSNNFSYQHKVLQGLQIIADNTQNGNASFDGQLVQDGDPVSETNPLPVSGPLTDDQLRAAAVPVLGPLTDTELRASALPVSATTLPLPTGASTEVKQDLEILEIQKVVKNTIKFYTEDVEEDTSTLTTYVGKQSVDGQWMVQKIVDTVVGTITTTSLQYATGVNNSGILNYENAWVDRTILIYSEIKNLL
jgi:hypothetical protein